MHHNLQIFIIDWNQLRLQLNIFRILQHCSQFIVVNYCLSKLHEEIMFAYAATWNRG